jgi:hypothetical protein
VKLSECDNVTRVEIIDGSGRAYTTGSYKTEVYLQDMGLTLKIFIDALPYRAIYRRKLCGSKMKTKPGNTGEDYMNIMENMRVEDIVLMPK